MSFFGIRPNPVSGATLLVGLLIVFTKVDMAPYAFRDTIASFAVPLEG